MDDRELNQLLREWKAPDAPPHLIAPRHSSPPHRQSIRGRGWWVWLLTGSIRIPVPVGIAAALIAALWLYTSESRRAPAPAPPPASQPVVSLADFQPVADVEVRVVGELK
jgi:hypothetical protein